MRLAYVPALVVIGAIIILVSSQHLMMYPINRRDSQKHILISFALWKMCAKTDIVAWERYQSSGTTYFWLVEANRATNLATIVRGLESMNGVCDLIHSKTFDHLSDRSQVAAVVLNHVLTQDCGSVASTSPWLGNVSQPLNDTIVLAMSKSSTTKLTPAPTRLPRRTVIQRNAPQDLALVSWAPAKFLPSKIKGYVYNAYWGFNTYIYLIEDGFNVDHRVRQSNVHLYQI